MAKRSIHNRVSVQRKDRMEKAFKMRKQGYSCDEIAAKLGRCVRTIRADLVASVKEWIKHHEAEIGDYVALDLSRMDTMLTQLTPAMESGNTKAIEVGLKVLHQRAQLLGLNKTQATIAPEQTAELANIIRRFEEERQAELKQTEANR